VLWEIVRTDTFSQTFKKYQKNKIFVYAIDKRMQRLKENPHNVGGYLSGRIDRYKSARLIGKLRLIFGISEKSKIVYLIATDHRKFDSKRF